MDLQDEQGFKIFQRKELIELLAFESRNKYEIATFDGKIFGFAAEDGTNLSSVLLRQFLGHKLRKFNIQFYDSAGNPFVQAFHPFRWFFHRLEVRDSSSGRFLGALQRKFSILTKRFDLESDRGQVLLTVKSPFWRIWNFKFQTASGRVVATIQKKWGGLLKEAFLDADNFTLQFNDLSLPDQHKKVLLAAAIFIDLMYFEKRANK